MMARPIRVALLADYLEEMWPSMDLVAEMTAQALSRIPSLHVELIRPRRPSPFSSRFTSHGAVRNLDRFLGRFLHYPRHASRIASSFDFFHVLDHSYSQLLHSLPPGRGIVTCHDLDTFRCLIDPAQDRRPLWFRQMANRIWSGMHSAAHVICVSEQTRRELSAASPGLSPRLSVLHNGTAPEYFGPEQSDAADWLQKELSARSGNPSLAVPFLLHVGSTIPRKRIPFLLRVFSGLLRRYPDLWLFRVGGKLEPEQCSLATELGVAHRVLTLPFLERSHLRVLYGQALALLQTSSYEGFGLPVTEALASACPVIACDIPIYREVGGTAAFYCPQDHIEPWIDCTTALIAQKQTDPGAWRATREQGCLWAQRFHWDSVAQSLSKRYRYLSEGTGIR